uniref:DENN domain containing 6B n=1 Tax=Sus scrofa TaxID=9823 RepID=A0A8D1D479_PIG
MGVVLQVRAGRPAVRGRALQVHVDTCSPGSCGSFVPRCISHPEWTNLSLVLQRSAAMRWGHRTCLPSHPLGLWGGPRPRQSRAGCLLPSLVLWGVGRHASRAWGPQTSPGQCDAACGLQGPSLALGLTPPSLLSEPPSGPRGPQQCPRARPVQVLPARAGPRADAVGARASRGAPGGPGALARCVLRDGAGLDQLPAAPQVLLRLPPLLHRPRQRVQGVHDAHTGPVSPVPPQPLSPHARLSLPLPPSLSLSLSRPNVVLGVTNPFFIKTLQHWPHILRVGEPRMSGDLPKQVKLKKPSRLKTLDTKPGLYTAYTAHLHRDKALLRRLLKGLQKKRPSDVQTALLRRHLLELTQSFIFPLEHYMASLMPLQKSITPWKTPPQIRPFRQDDFLRSLEHAGPQLTCVLKGDWLGLYRRFFKSPHFDGWYRQRRKEMAQKLEALHLEAICEANIEVWMKGKSEVEVVDLVLKLRERLVRAQGHQLPVKEATLKQARLYIETVISSLPKDLQVILCPP